MKNICQTIVLIALGCVLFASSAAARGGHHAGGTGMGRGNGMGSGDMGGMGMGGMGRGAKAQ